MRNAAAKFGGVGSIVRRARRPRIWRSGLLGSVGGVARMSVAYILDSCLTLSRIECSGRVMMGEKRESSV